MGRLAAGVLAILACCWTGGLRSARAEEPTPLVFFFTTDLESSYSKMARGALDEVAVRSGTVVIDLSAEISSEGRTDVELQRGIEAYRRFEYEEALGHLDKGLEEASANGALGLSHSGLSDLLIYRALVLERLGDSARSWDDFVRAAVVDPTRKLDPVRFAPHVVETFDRAVQAVVGRVSIPVTIDADAGCEVRFDGRVLGGSASLTVPKGEHYAHVSCDGKAPYGARVLVQGASYVLKPELRPLRAPSRAEVLAEARRRGAMDVLWCVLSTSKRGGATLAMQRIAGATGAVRSAVVLRLSGGDEDRAAVVAAAARLIQDEPIVGPAPRSSRSTPWYKRPWFWAVAGVVATSAVLLPFTLEGGRPTGFDVGVDYQR